MFPLLLLAGISLKSLELYLLVHCTRYLDLFVFFYSLYNSVYKVFYIGTSILAVTWIRQYLSSSNNTGATLRAYDPDMDTVSHWKFVVAPCVPIALVTLAFRVISHRYVAYNYTFSWLELAWTFSIYLEAVAMLPQLVLVWRHRRVERWAGFYIFCMGLYRIFYIMNWIYRAHYEPHYRHHYVVYVCGVVQSVLYADFFYYACTKRDRPLLAWRRTVAGATAANANNMMDPLLSAEEQMRVV